MQCPPSGSKDKVPEYAGKSDVSVPYNSMSPCHNAGKTSQPLSK